MNKNRIFTGVLALLCSVAFFSCKKEIVKNTDGGTLYQPYVPMQIGKHIVYDVDSSIWDDNLCVKFSRQYQMEYVVADTFRDGQNRLSYRIDVYIRKGDTAQWKINDVVYMTPAAEKLELVEKNIRYIRMVNPVKENYTWKGNSLMPAEDHDYDYMHPWVYKYGDMLQPYDNGKRTFENTITVTEVDSTFNNPETKPTLPAAKIFSKSVYAYGIGMVYHEYLYWTYEPQPSTTICRKGYGVVLRAVEYN